MIQVHPGILLHPMILLGELFQRPHLFGRTRTGCPWGSVHGLSFPLEGVHGIPTSSRFHISVDICETSRPPGCGQRLGLFSPLWEMEAGRCEGALPASVGMAITPFTTSDTPAPPACLQQPAPSLARLFLWESPTWQMAFRHSIS